MKIKYFILTVIVIVAVSVLTGYKVNREKKLGYTNENLQQAKQDLKDAQSEFNKDWKQFKVDANLKIKANEKSIAEFKVKIKKEDRKFKAQYKKEVTVLEQKNVELKNKLREYKYEGKDKWEEFKIGFNHDMDVVGKSIKDFFAKKD
jgi:phage-related minor tail protein